MLANGVEGVRRPVEDEQAGGGYGTAIVAGDPAGVFAFDDHARDPRLEAVAHGVADGLAVAAHGGEHGLAVGGDKGSIGGGGGAGFQHGGSIWDLAVATRNVQSWSFGMG